MNSGQLAEAVSKKEFRCSGSLVILRTSDFGLQTPSSRYSILISQYKNMKVLLSKINPDIVGFITSMLCAIHCAVLPFLITLAPLAGLTFFDNSYFEYGIIATSFLIAAYALIHGYRSHHRKPLALIMVSIGFFLIGAGHWFPVEWAEPVFNTTGALMVAIAHFVNWKYVRQSAIQYPDCLHKSETK